MRNHIQLEGQGKLRVRSQTDYGNKIDVDGYHKVGQEGSFSVRTSVLKKLRMTRNANRRVDLIDNDKNDLG